VRLSSVFAAQVRAGMAAPFGSVAQFSPTDVGVDPQVARVPLAYRFRIGGVNSVRGFEENSLVPSGGLALFQANLEMRMSVIGPFGLEVYADAGNIWTGASHIHLGDFFPSTRTRTVHADDVRYVFGFGPRLILPFGPLRLDFTWIPRRSDLAASDDPGQWWMWKRKKVQFAIGPSF
jgi:outer membrane protein assembly factor BamA